MLRCYPTLYCLDPAEPNLTPEIILHRSPLLYWAAVAVGSRESPDLEDTYRTARSRVLELFRLTLGGPAITYWDLCGAMVYHKWLSPIRPIGEHAYEVPLTNQVTSSIWHTSSGCTGHTITSSTEVVPRKSKS